MKGSTTARDEAKSTETAAAMSQTSGDVRERAAKHILYPWSIQSQLNPIMFTRGKGARLWDSTGTEYLDLASQLCNVNLGYQDERVIRAMQEASRELCYLAPNYVTEAQVQLGEVLAEITPGDLTHSFFTVGGSEANEVAVQLARLATGRQKIVTRYRSYHGATYGAHTLSGGLQRLHAGAGIPDVIHVREQYCYRCPFGKNYPGCNLECAQQFEQVLELEGPENVAAIMVEPIAANDGVLVPPPEYLTQIRQLCDEHGILLIFDEILTGFGRTGRWFASEHWDVVPDMVTLSKGLTSGYAALGAVVIRDPVASYFDDHAIPFGFTNGGQPLAFNVALAVINAYREDSLIEGAATSGVWLLEELRSMQERHPSIGDVRGLGLMIGIELVTDRATRNPAAPSLVGVSAARVDNLTPFKRRLLDLGLVVQLRGNVLRLYPPLCVTRPELADALTRIDEALSLVDELMSTDVH